MPQLQRRASVENVYALVCSTHEMDVVVDIYHYRKAAMAVKRHGTCRFKYCEHNHLVEKYRVK